MIRAVLQSEFSKINDIPILALANIHVHVDDCVRKLAQLSFSKWQNIGITQISRGLE